LTHSCILVVHWYEQWFLFPLPFFLLVPLRFGQLVSLFVHPIFVRLRDLVDMLHLSCSSGNFDGPRCNTVTGSFSHLQT
jgi:ABC-type polysaccharide/polyol phosphate export permease